MGLYRSAGHTKVGQLASSPIGKGTTDGIMTAMKQTATKGEADRPDAAWQKLSQRYADNGPLWSIYHVLSRSSGWLSRYFEAKSRDLERSRGKPGINTVAYNRAAWSDHDWSRGGEEWSPSPEWREAVIREFLRPNLADGGAVVEIGPGAGRWTGELHRQAEHLYLVDITQTTLDICRDKLAPADNVACILSDGSSLPGVADNSIDFVWSFDVFVHVAPDHQRRYLAECARVMRPGAKGVIHHSGDGGMRGGWRSPMTSELFKEMLADSGLHVLRQTESWGPEGEFRCTEPGDVVTLFEA